MDSCLFELDLDRDFRAVEEHYEFLSEYHIGPFVIVPFSKAENESKEEQVQIIIYEGGDIIDPTKDSRFKRKQWIKPGVAWVDHLFTRSSLQQVIKDIRKIKTSSKTSLRRNKRSHTRAISRDSFLGQDFGHHRIFSMFEEQESKLDSLNSLSKIQHNLGVPRGYGFKTFHHQQEDEKVNSMVHSLHKNRSIAAPISPPPTSIISWARSPPVDKDNFASFCSPD